MIKKELLKLLKRDLEFEQKAKNGCAELLLMPEAKEYKDLILQIQRDEQKHIKMVERLIETIEE
jgi:rubrerythrin